MNYTLIPGAGLGNLKFGAPAPSIEEILGTPDEIEKDDDELFNSIIWTYIEKELTLFLQDDEVPFLISIESAHPDTILFNEKIFDLGEKEITELMKKHGLNEVETEDEEWGEHRVSFDEGMLDFYFDNDRLTSVNWSVITEDDEE
jgi:hypothetical protein